MITKPAVTRPDATDNFMTEATSMGQVANACLGSLEGESLSD